MCSEILFECILEYQLELKWIGNWQKLLDPNKILGFFLQCYFSIGKKLDWEKYHKKAHFKGSFKRAILNSLIHRNILLNLII